MGSNVQAEENTLIKNINKNFFLNDNINNPIRNDYKLFNFFVFSK